MKTEAILMGSGDRAGSRPVPPLIKPWSEVIKYGDEFTLYSQPLTFDEASSPGGFFQAFSAIQSRIFRVTSQKLLAKHRDLSFREANGDEKSRARDAGCKLRSLPTVEMKLGRSR